MEKVKIKRAKRVKKAITVKEKALAALGVGSTLLGAAGAVAPKPAETRFVRTQEQDKSSVGSKIKDTLKRIFGIEKAKAAEPGDPGYDPGFEEWKGQALTDLEAGYFGEPGSEGYDERLAAISDAAVAQYTSTSPTTPTTPVEPTGYSVVSPETLATVGTDLGAPGAPSVVTESSPVTGLTPNTIPLPNSNLPFVTDATAVFQAGDKRTVGGVNQTFNGTDWEDDEVPPGDTTPPAPGTTRTDENGDILVYRNGEWGAPQTGDVFTDDDGLRHVNIGSPSGPVWKVEAGQVKDGLVADGYGGWNLPGGTGTVTVTGDTPAPGTTRTDENGDILVYRDGVWGAPRNTDTFTDDSGLKYVYIGSYAGGTWLPEAGQVKDGLVSDGQGGWKTPGTQPGPGTGTPSASDIATVINLAQTVPWSSLTPDQQITFTNYFADGQHANEIPAAFGPHSAVAWALGFGPGTNGETRDVGSTTYEYNVVGGVGAWQIRTPPGPGPGPGPAGSTTPPGGGSTGLDAALVALRNAAAAGVTRVPTAAEIAAANAIWANWGSATDTQQRLARNITYGPQGTYTQGDSVKRAVMETSGETFKASDMPKMGGVPVKSDGTLNDGWRKDGNDRYYNTKTAVWSNADGSIQAFSSDAFYRAATPEGQDLVANDAYWAEWAAKYPPEDRAKALSIRGMSGDERRAAAMNLLSEHPEIPMDWMIIGYDQGPAQINRQRLAYGYTWVPNALQPNVEIAPGLGAFGSLKAYDPKNAPAGSIIVSTDAAGRPHYTVASGQGLTPLSTTSGKTASQAGGQTSVDTGTTGATGTRTPTPAAIPSPASLAALARALGTTTLTPEQAQTRASRILAGLENTSGSATDKAVRDAAWQLIYGPQGTYTQSAGVIAAASGAASGVAAFSDPSNKPLAANGSLSPGWIDMGAGHYYDTKTGVYSNRDGTIKATTSNAFGDREREVFLNGFRFVSDPNIKAGENPQQYASLATATALARALGGTVTTTTVGGPNAPTPQYMIKFPNGVELNAGLVAQTYLNNSPYMANQLIGLEVGRAGGSAFTSANFGKGTAASYIPGATTANPSGAGNQTGSGTTTVVNTGTTGASITTTSLPQGGVGMSYSFSLVSRGITNARWSVTGVLPPGLNLSQSGLITGVPTAAGTFTFNVMAANTQGASAVRTLSITIQQTRTIQPIGAVTGVGTQGIGVGTGAILGTNPANTDAITNQVIITNVNSLDKTGKNAWGKVGPGYTIEIGGQGLSVYKQFSLNINGTDYSVTQSTVTDNKIILKVPMNLPTSLPNGALVKVRIASTVPGVAQGLLAQTFSYAAPAVTGTAPVRTTTTTSTSGATAETESDDLNLDEEGVVGSAVQRQSNLLQASQLQSASTGQQTDNFWGALDSSARLGGVTQNQQASATTSQQTQTASTGTAAQTTQQSNQQIQALTAQIQLLENRIAALSAQSGNTNQSSQQLQAAQQEIASLRQQIASLTAAILQAQQAGTVRAFNAGGTQTATGLQMPAGYTASGGGLQMPPGYPASEGYVPPAGQVEGSATKASYKVKKGDTLWAIAKKQYNDGKKWRKILQANPDCLSKPGNTKTLKVGFELVIPE